MSRVKEDFTRYVDNGLRNYRQNKTFEDQGLLHELNKQHALDFTNKYYIGRRENERFC